MTFGTAACSGPSVRVVAPGEAPAISGPPEVLALVAEAVDGGTGVDADPEGLAASFRPESVEVEGCAGDADVATTAANFADRTRGWAGGDLMDRVELPDGRVLWIFGDTFVGDVDAEGRLASGHRFVHSSAVIQDGTCFDMVETDDGWGWVSWLPDGTWLWPQEATLDGAFLHVFMVRVEHLPGVAPGLDFRVVGGALAVFSLDDLSHPFAVIDGTPAVDGHPFGFGVVRDGGHHYTYAHINRVGSFVSRVPVGQLADFDSWEYWDGSVWQPDVARARPVASQRLRVAAAADGGFVALGLPFGSTVVSVARAEAPQGPFVPVDEVSLAAIVDLETGWAYEPLFMELAGEQAMTVNLLPWDTDSIPDQVGSYGPRFVALD